MNIQKKYVKIAKEFIKPFIKDKNIIGITLNGGISRGTGDVFSEIDIHFIVKDKNKSKNLPPRISGLGGDISINGVWFDISIDEINEERRKEYNMDHKWDMSQCKILFERNKAITNLIKQKVKFNKEEKKKLAWNYGLIGHWSIELAEIFVKRGDIINSHLLINNALDAFVNKYFIINNEFIPHFKWKYYYFKKLKKPSRKIKNAIFEAYKIRTYSKQELKIRLKIVKEIIIHKGFREKIGSYHQQDLGAIKNFIRSLKRGINYSNPFK